MTMERKDRYEQELRRAEHWPTAVSIVSEAVSRERMRLMFEGMEDNPEAYVKSAALQTAWERILRG